MSTRRVIYLREKSIAAGALVVSIIALVFAGYSVYAPSSRAPAAPTVLVYDVEFTDVFSVNPAGNSSTCCSTGDTFYGEGNIFLQDQIDKAAPVGMVVWFGTFANSHVSVTLAIFNITGKGEIITNGREDSAPGPPCGDLGGVIVGGTGQFAGIAEHMPMRCARIQLCAIPLP